MAQSGNAVKEKPLVYEISPEKIFTIQCFILLVVLYWGVITYLIPGPEPFIICILVYIFFVFVYQFYDFLFDISTTFDHPELLSKSELTSLKNEMKYKKMKYDFYKNKNDDEERIGKARRAFEEVEAAYNAQIELRNLCRFKYIYGNPLPPASEVEESLEVEEAEAATESSNVEEPEFSTQNPPPLKNAVKKPKSKEGRFCTDLGCKHRLCKILDSMPSTNESESAAPFDNNKYDESFEVPRCKHRLHAFAIKTPDSPVRFNDNVSHSARSRIQNHVTSTSDGKKEARSSLKDKVYDRSDKEDPDFLELKTSRFAARNSRLASRTVRSASDAEVEIEGFSPPEYECAKRSTRMPLPVPRKPALPPNPFSKINAEKKNCFAYEKMMEKDFKVVSKKDAPGFSDANRKIKKEASPEKETRKYPYLATRIPSGASKLESSDSSSESSDSSSDSSQSSSITDSSFDSSKAYIAGKKMPSSKSARDMIKYD